MLDVSVSVKPGEAHTLWLDLRDRILPNEQGPVPDASPAPAPDFGAGVARRRRGPPGLQGAQGRRSPSTRSIASRRCATTTRTLVEESPRTRRLNLFNRVRDATSTDLLRVDPDHVLGRQYWYDYNSEQPRPPVTLPAPPAGVPLWAFRQVELLALREALRQLVHRQPPDRERRVRRRPVGRRRPHQLLAGHGAHGRRRRTRSRGRCAASMDAFYEQGMFTNGLSTIQTDELHSYEEGIQVLGAGAAARLRQPEAARARDGDGARALERITGVNAAGHRHIRSSYFSGTKMADGGRVGLVEAVVVPRRCTRRIALVDFNGAPRVQEVAARAGRRPAGAPQRRRDRRAVDQHDDRVRDRQGRAAGDRPADRALAAAVGGVSLDRRPEVPAAVPRRRPARARAARRQRARPDGRARVRGAGVSGSWRAGRRRQREPPLRLAGDRRHEVPRGPLRRPGAGRAAARVHQHRGQPVDRPRQRARRRDPARAARAASRSSATTSIPATP